VLLPVFGVLLGDAAYKRVLCGWVAGWGQSQRGDIGTEKTVKPSTPLPDCSLGLASVSKEQIDSRTFEMVSAGLH